MGTAYSECCLGEKNLEPYLAGTCSAGEMANLESHILACPQCRQWVADARANEVLLQDMRRALGESPEGLGLYRPSIVEQTTVTAAEPGETAGAGVGPDFVEGYRIVKEIGRGGMGVVYQACQLSTRRMAAVKVMLEGSLASQAARRRFEREIELAASLNHPNIVAIYDSGLARGRYYFAMDCVAGVRLDQYVRQRDLATAERLGLLRKICLAVHYAHQRGVIHRDLKPSNILIDERGEPHILDFGLAKSIESPAGESLLISAAQQLIGTLPYMAPEQAGAGEADSRTDVYALGVILYEMLTGTFPYPVTGPLAAVLHSIVNTEPARPGSIGPRIDHDLETIVLKALAKDKEQRYDSAGALAADIERYLAGEAIEAKRHSGLYVLRKTLQRYRVAAAMAAGVLVLSILAAVVMYSLYWRALGQQQLAEQSGQQLAAELRVRTIQEGRALTLAGDFAQAEQLFWGEMLEHPGDPQAFWGLREVYRRYPCLAKIPVPSTVVRSVAFRPDGRVLACTGEQDRRIWLWEVPSGRPLADHASGLAEVTSICYSPDGRLVAVADNSGQAEVWDSAFERCLQRVPAAAGSTTQPGSSADGTTGALRQRSNGRVCFHPDSRMIALYGMDACIRLWSVQTGEPAGVLDGQEGRVASASFSPDGRSLASGGAGGVVRLWDVPGRRVRQTLRGHASVVVSTAFSGDGQVLGTGSADGMIRLWEVSSGRCLAGLEGHREQLRSIAFGPDGRMLASCDASTVQLCDLSNGQCVATIPAPVPDVARERRWRMGIAFSPRGDMLAAFDSPGLIELWQPPCNRQRAPRNADGGSVACVVRCPNGRGWISRSEDGRIALWDETGSAASRTLEPPHDTASPRQVEKPDIGARLQQSAALSENGQWLASVTADRSGIDLYRMPSGEWAGRLEGRGGEIMAVRCDQDGQSLQSVDRAGRIDVWDVANCQFVRSIQDTTPGPTIGGICFAPNGRLMAYVQGAAVLLRNVPAGLIVSVLEGDHSSGWSIAFSPDSRLLACSADELVRIWDVASGRCTAILRGYAGAAYSVAFSPDGQLLASAHHKGVVKLWDTASGHCLASLDGDERPLWSVHFSLDGRQLICGGEGGIHTWDLAAYDRHVQGNAEYYMAMARRLGGISAAAEKDLHEWARGLGTVADEPQDGWEAAAAKAATAGSGGTVEMIESWGHASRLRPPSDGRHE